MLVSYIILPTIKSGHQIGPVRMRISLSSGLVVVAFNEISTNSGRLAGEF
jgi:hypothetical protein